SSVTTRLWLGGLLVLVPVAVDPLKVKSVSVPRVKVTLVTIGLLNSTPRNSAWPCVPTGTKYLHRLRLPWKNSMLVGLAASLLMKTAPNPRVPARVGVVVAALGRTKDWWIVLSLNMAKVL